MACPTCGSVCIITTERSFEAAQNSCDVQLTLDDSVTPGSLSGSLVVDNSVTNLLTQGTCGWQVTEADVVTAVVGDICNILSNASVDCLSDVNTAGVLDGNTLIWNGLTSQFEAGLSGGYLCGDAMPAPIAQSSSSVATATKVVDSNGNTTVPDVNGNILLASTATNTSYVTGGQLVAPGTSFSRKTTTYTLTPTQTVGATATTPNITYGIPSVPYDSIVIIDGRQIIATSYVGAGGSHFVRMTNNISSTGPAVLSPVTRDVTVGFAGYSGDSAEMYTISQIIVPANTPAFTITINNAVRILGTTGTPAALGTSGVYEVEQIPHTGVIV